MGFWGVRFWLSRYGKRDKKIFKLAVLGVQVATVLIEGKMAGSVQRAAARGRKSCLS
jgi:hypothetical protein